jgi:hypothetical protein
MIITLAVAAVFLSANASADVGAAPSMAVAFTNTTPVNVSAVTVYLLGCQKGANASRAITQFFYQADEVTPDEIVSSPYETQTAYAAMMNLTESGGCAWVPNVQTYGSPCKDYFATCKFRNLIPKPFRVLFVNADNPERPLVWVTPQVSTVSFDAAYKAELRENGEIVIQPIKGKARDEAGLGVTNSPILFLVTALLTIFLEIAVVWVYVASQKLPNGFLPFLANFFTNIVTLNVSWFLLAPLFVGSAFLAVWVPVVIAIVLDTVGFLYLAGLPTRDAVILGFATNAMSFLGGSFIISLGAGAISRLIAGS